MNSPIALDEQGHILINDSMSDELKEKIALYNQIGDTEILEEELPEGDMPLDESDDIVKTGDDSVEFESIEVKVSEDELDSLNELFK